VIVEVKYNNTGTVVICCAQYSGISISFLCIFLCWWTTASNQPVVHFKV